MKKVLLLATGGTIACTHSEEGLTPGMSGDGILDWMPELREGFAIESRDILNLDSSNIQPEEWQFMAEQVAEALPDYDGIIITHGTDTMAYTASALSYMLQNLTKPVVLTGAQIPIDQMFTDAKRNLQTAFAAVDAGLSGVMVAFDDKIMGGCRAVKVRTMGFDAFESISAPYIGKIYADGVHLEHSRAGEEAAAPFELKNKLCTDVFLMKLIPGTRPEIFDSLLELGYRGVVIEAFGAGGTHFERRWMIKFNLTLRAGFLKGRTQCGIGRHAARNGELVQTALFHRNHSMLHQHVADCLLERGRHVGAINLNAFHLASVQIIQHGRFQAAEAEVIGGILEFGAWKRNSIRIALFRYLVNLRATGIAQTDGAGHFVEGFACGVVPGPSENLIFSIIPDC